MYVDNSTLPPDQSQISRKALALILGLVLVAVALLTWSCVANRRARAALIQGDTQHVQGVIEKAKGEVYGQESIQLRHQVDAKDRRSDQVRARVLAADREVAARQARVERLQAGPPSSGPGPVPSGGVDPALSAGGRSPAADGDLPHVQALEGAESDLIVSLRKALQERDALLASQDEALKARDVLIASLTARADHWEAAAKAFEREAAARQIALEAQLSAARAQRWLGRGEGAGAVLLCRLLLGGL